MPRIRPIRTEAIVLRQRPLGDADRICVLFSPTRGRIEAVAKGVRKPLSKLAGHVEPLSRGQFGLAPGRSLFVVTDAQTLDSWPSLHDDVARMTEALAMAELVDRSTDVDVSSGPLYQLLRHSLDALAESPCAARNPLVVHPPLLRPTGIPTGAGSLRALPRGPGAGGQRLLVSRRRRRLSRLSRSGPRAAVVITGVSIVTLYAKVVGRVDGSGAR